ncbi:MAG: hypothetical protein LBE91_09130 [Tannerella sp.]|jgi:hypothetical protein|nr:hypothetical protein [Tannerella sp.]
MKYFILFLTALLFAGMTACGDSTDGLLGDISPDTESQVIEKEIDGIAFKFCLLNRQGEPATVFNEGDNIVFSFSFKNNLKDNISIPTQFINENFYRVYGNNNTDMGKAWTGTWCLFVMQTKIIELPAHETKELNCPWLYSEVFKVDYPLCKGGDNNPLSKGEYFTSLHFDFVYTVDGKQKSIENVNLNINFKIQ